MGQIVQQTDRAGGGKPPSLLPTVTVAPAKADIDEMPRARAAWAHLLRMFMISPLDTVEGVSSTP